MEITIGLEKIPLLSNADTQYKQHLEKQTQDGLASAHKLNPLSAVMNNRSIRPPVNGLDILMEKAMENKRTLVNEVNFVETSA